MLPWIALAPLVWLLGRPRAPLLGLVHGTVSWIVAIPWIVPTLVTYGEIPRPLAVVLFTLLAAYLGAYHAAFAWLGRLLWRRGGAALLALPALWCVLEVVRSWLISGFPWNLAGTPGSRCRARSHRPRGSASTACRSCWCWPTSASACAVARRRWEPALAAGARRSSRARLRRRAGPGPQPEPGPAVPVRILQPNTPILEFRRSRRDRGRLPEDARA